MLSDIDVSRCRVCLDILRIISKANKRSLWQSKVIYFHVSIHLPPRTTPESPKVNSENTSQVYELRLKI